MVGYNSKACKIVSLILLLILAFGVFFGVFGSFLTQNDVVANANSSGAEVVVEVYSGRVLRGKNIDARLPMASTTKAMTALVVIENAKDLQKIVTIPKSAVGIEGSSIYLKEGEKLTIKELLYGLMLRSGNDSAVALAIETAGSVEKFVKLMNERVKSLGLKNTNFVNPHGLHDKNHYTSAYDLAIIAAEGMKNEIFRQIVSTKFYTVERENSEEKRYFANKNRILYSYSGANGVKTGYTTDAGRCLIASSERAGMQVVAVALDCYDYFNKCAELMDYAHDNYYMAKVADKNTSYCEVKVNKSKVKTTELHVLEDEFYPLKKGSEEVSYEIDAVKEITAPHKSSDNLGEIRIKLGNHLLFTKKLYTINNIEKKKWFDFMSRS